MHSVEKGGTFEQSSGIFFFEGKELSGCFSESGEEEMDSPDFSLVLEAVGADESQLVDKLFLFEGSPRCVGGLCVYEQTSVKAWALTVRVLLWHLVGLIYKAYRYQ